MSVRCGIGYDLHRLAEGRKLIIGGIEVPFDKGPVGHSDGDVVAHALCDALLGAAGLGDIGTHFPDTDPKWKGANSLLFLEHARKLLDEKHLAIEHVDAVVILERPKLGPYFPRMREALGKALRVPSEKIHGMLHGRVQETQFGERFRNDKDVKLPIHTTFLDPLERIKEADAVLGDVRWLEGLRAVFSRARKEKVPTVLDPKLRPKMTVGMLSPIGPRSSSSRVFTLPMIMLVTSATASSTSSFTD